MRSRGTLAGATMKLASARILSMGLGVLTAPVIARLYRPRHFGVMGLLMSVAAIASAFRCLGYSHAIPLSESRAEARSLLKLCLVLTLGLLVPLGCIALSARSLLADLLGDPQVGQLIWCVPILFVQASLTESARLALSWEGRFGIVSVADFVSPNLARLLSVAFAYAIGAAAVTLLAAQLVARLVDMAIVGLAACLVLWKANETHHRRPCRLTAAAKRHQQFPKVQVWNTVLNTASRWTPVLLLGGLFGTRTVGYYSFSRGYLLVPITILGASVAQAFYPEAAREWRETGSTSDTVMRTLRILGCGGVFPMIAVGMLGPLLFSIVFSNRWVEAGVYAQIISPWLIMVLLGSPISTIFLIARRAKCLLGYNVALGIARPAALVLAAAAGGPRLALACFTGVSVIIWLHQLDRIFQIGKVDRRQASALLSKEVLRAVALLLPAAVAYWLFELRWVSIALLSGGALAHLALLYRREPAVRRRISQMLKGVLSGAGGPRRLSTGG